MPALADQEPLLEERDGLGERSLAQAHDPERFQGAGHGEGVLGRLGQPERAFTAGACFGEGAEFGQPPGRPGSGEHGGRTR